MHPTYIFRCGTHRQEHVLDFLTLQHVLAHLGRQRGVILARRHVFDAASDTDVDLALGDLVGDLKAEAALGYAFMEYGMRLAWATAMRPDEQNRWTVAIHAL